MNYIINTNVVFDCGFEINSENIVAAINHTNNSLLGMPWVLFKNIDFKTMSSIIGAFFCSSIAQLTPGIVNPIEKGHPDIVPPEALTATEEQLRNYPKGLEIKCTIGFVKKNSNLSAGHSRIDSLNGITWQAHHQEVGELLGIVFDFLPTADGHPYPIITGAFYSDNLSIDDWGQISGTTGRNTKVCGMLTSGKEKMGTNWIAILNDPRYINTYKKIFKITDL